MQDIIMFLIFVTIGIMCDILNRNVREGKVVITAYCLLTVCALAVVISVGSGINVPSPNTALKGAIKLLYR